MIFEAIRRFTDSSRVWVGEEIAREYYHDEMPNYGTYPPELYVEVVNKEEVSAIMAYAYENNIPVVCRGAGTGLAGGASCKFGGIMLSVMRMNRIFPVDHKNQTITVEPGALLTDVQAAARAGGTFLSSGSRGKDSFYRRQRDHQRRRNERPSATALPETLSGVSRQCFLTAALWRFSSNVVKNTTGYDFKGPGHRKRGNPLCPDPGYPETSSHARENLHPGDPIPFSGGMRGHGPGGPGTALCAYGY